MSKSEKPRTRKRKKEPSHLTASEPAVNQTSWDELEISLRGLRNLNAMQLQLIGHAERMGKALRRKRT